MRKEEIRSRIKARKAMLTDAERQSAADAVFAVLENSVAFMLCRQYIALSFAPRRTLDQSVHREMARPQEFLSPKGARCQP